MSFSLKHALPLSTLLPLVVGGCGTAPPDAPADETQHAQELIIPTDGGTPPNTSCSDTGSPFLCIGQVYTGIENFGEPSQWQTVTGDFDGDGKTDYARLGDDHAWVFYATGTGSFQAVRQQYVSPISGFGLPSTWDAVTGDFDGDGKADYARVGASGAWMFFGTGSRTAGNTFVQKFVEFGDGLVMAQPSPYQTIAGDFDGDKRTDIARLGDTGLLVFHYDGSPNFHIDDLNYANLVPRPPSFGLPSPWTPIVGDFDHDGITDYARLGATEAWIFYGRPNLPQKFSSAQQTYRQPISSFGLPSSTQAIVGDFNGDGFDDYMRLDAGGAWTFMSTPGLLGFNQGFAPYNGLNFGSPSAFTPIVGDFDGDGKVDYGRLQGTGAWMFYSAADAKGDYINDGRGTFFGYNNKLDFGTPTRFTTITGKFGHDGRASYARLGATSEWTFIHD